LLPFFHDYEPFFSAQSGGFNIKIEYLKLETFQHEVKPTTLGPNYRSKFIYRYIPLIRVKI
jgi:hypothetical protein